MKLRLGYIILFIASVVTLGKTDISVRKISVFGAKNISSSEVKSWIGLKTKSVFNFEHVLNSCHRVLENYAAQGYPFTRIDSVNYNITSDSSAVDLSFYITEAAQIKIGGIEFSGLDSLESKRIRNRFDTQPGKKFTPIQFEADMADAVSQMEKKGYPFTNFELKTIILDTTNQLYFDLKTNLGPQLVINEIQVTGNTITRKKVIVRETRIKQGSVFNPARVERIRNRLMRLGFFDSVAEPKVFWASKNVGGLLLHVKEGNPNRFDGVLGYNPGAEGESGYFTGLVDISLGNLFGTGRALSVHMQKRDRESQDFEFHYREPWVAGFPVNFGIGLEQIMQDDPTYIQRNIGMDISMPILDNFSILAGVFQTSISPDSLSSYLLGLPKSRSLNASLCVQYDSRDDLLNPQKGIFYQTGIESGSKKNTGPQDVIAQYEIEQSANRKSISLDVEFFTPIF
ncbi:BamA/TamA family outer membrane protein, partial [candidate division KSB1 bacterium]|nr:BamA/TamA family outer membrane protein [candidate division KSB1 bacterium]